MSVQSDLASYASPTKAKASQWFFKTGKGQYGEGDQFIGVTVPEQRLVAKKHAGLTLAEIATLLDSPIHEHRLTALFILVSAYAKGTEEKKKEVYNFYLAHAKRMNNWDLVDSSAGYIVGEWLSTRQNDRKILYQLAKSKDLWERRIAIIATQAFIKRSDFADTLAIAEMLLPDTHDLIHKAVGWMLREVGKKDIEAEERFLKVHHKTMPRTMLRYAIEKFPLAKREYYMSK